jgi:hypothetical protein
MADRRLARVPKKVVHRHQMGRHVFTRISELAFIRGRPKAILRWLDLAGVRTPIYADLDPAKLRRVRARTRVAAYDGTTLDPSDVVQRPPVFGKRRRTDLPMAGGRRRGDPPSPPT